MKHTPGPWTIRFNTNVFAGERLVANTGGYFTNRSDEDEVIATNNANAQLIAAAPDMYRLLKIIDGFDFHNIDWDVISEAGALLRKIEES